MNEPVHAIIYARSAVDDPVRIVEQVRLCRDFAGARGWIVVGEYADSGLSGIGTDNRPGLETAMTALRAGNVLLTEEISRLSRNMMVDIYRDLTARGVRVVTTDGLVDSAEPPPSPSLIYLGQTLHCAFDESDVRMLRRRRTLRLRLGARGSRGK